MQEEAFGEARLVETLETHKHLQPEQLIDKVFFGVSNFTQNVPQSDDQTLLVINIS
jgi:serine phosphatase RsbU (regulator of sigma subunit)